MLANKDKSTSARERVANPLMVYLLEGLAAEASERGHERLSNSYRKVQIPHSPTLLCTYKGLEGVGVSEEVSTALGERAGCDAVGGSGSIHSQETGQAARACEWAAREAAQEETGPGAEGKGQSRQGGKETEARCSTDPYCTECE